MKLKIRPFVISDEKAVVQLWTDCGLVVPWNNPHRDIKRKLKVQSDLFFVGCSGDHIIATVMSGYDGHRGWINYLAVHPQHQRKGIARQMMDEAEANLRAVGCPKINLQVRSTNAGVIEFYKTIGFEIDDVVSFGKRLEPDECAEQSDREDRAGCAALGVEFFRLTFRASGKLSGSLCPTPQLSVLISRYPYFL